MEGRKEELVVIEEKVVLVVVVVLVKVGREVVGDEVRDEDKEGRNTEESISLSDSLSSLISPPVSGAHFLAASVAAADILNMGMLAVM